MKTGKTLLLTSSYPRFKGDYAGTFVAEYARLFKSLGEVTVLAPADLKVDPKYRPFDIPVLRFASRYNKKRGPFYGSGGPENLRKFNRLIESPLAFWQMFKAASSQARNADNIISHWMVPAGLIGALIKRKNQKLQIVVHGGDWHLLRKFPLGKKLARYIIRKADDVIVVAKYQQNQILDLFNNRKQSLMQTRIRHLPMGIDIRKFSKNVSPEDNKNNSKPVVLAVGRLVPIKGFDRLAKALEDLDLQLWIAGDGPQRDSLEKTFKKHNIDVRFLGMLSSDKLVDVYHLADMLVFPSRPEIGRVEGTPRVLIEAMAAKCPIVATATGGVSELLVHQSDSMLDYLDDKELKSNIKCLLDSKQIRTRLANKAFEKVRKMDWSKISTQVLDVFEVKNAKNING